MPARKPGNHRAAYLFIRDRAKMNFYAKRAAIIAVSNYRGLDPPYHSLSLSLYLFRFPRPCLLARGKWSGVSTLSKNSIHVRRPCFIQFLNFYYHFLYLLFLISLLFLIFDVEITLLIPIIIYIKFLNYLIVISILLLFLCTILITLIVERILGYLN